jgi:hypothetical protein
LILFEASALGLKFMLVRFMMDLIGIAIISYITEKSLTQKDKDVIYQKAQQTE